MENRFCNGRLSYFFTPRTHGNVLAWVKPAIASQRQRGKRVNENILRWEDDGGKVLAADEQPGQANSGSGTGKRIMDDECQWKRELMNRKVSGNNDAESHVS